MTKSQKTSALAAAAALAASLAALSAAVALAQSPDTRITVIGAINTPAHVQPVTDGRDDAIPEIPVVYDRAAQTAPAQAQPTSAPARNATQTQAEGASTGGANLSQAVKSQ